MKKNKAKLLLNKETIMNLEKVNLIKLAVGGVTLDYTFCNTECSCPDTR
jgi:hypothetical protein